MAFKARMSHVQKVSAPKVSASGIIREDEHSMAAMSVAGEAKPGTGTAAAQGQGHRPSKTKTQTQQPETQGEDAKAQKQCRSRQAAESKLRHMITNTGPDLFVHGTLSGEGQPGPGSGVAVVNPSLETTSATCAETAPFDLILEFMTAVMSREYERALEVGKKIVKCEPDNKIVVDFIPVLEEIAAFSASEDESSNDSSASESATTSSGATSSESDAGTDEGDEESDSELSPSSSAESDDEDEHSHRLEGEYSSAEDSCTEEEGDDDEDDTSGAATSDPGYDSMNPAHPIK